MKPCKKCGATDRYSSGVCRPCGQAATVAWNKANAEKKKADESAYRNANREKIKGQKAAFYKSNLEKHKVLRDAWRAAHQEYAAIYYEKNQATLKAKAAAYKKVHRGKMCALERKRKATKLHATPGWANAKKMEEFYYTANMLGMHTGEPYHVDHIVPLQSKLVCGLHCEANLQILEAKYNRSKGNRHWPDMP